MEFTLNSPNSLRNKYKRAAHDYSWFNKCNNKYAETTTGAYKTMICSKGIHVLDKRKERH